MYNQQMYARMVRFQRTAMDNTFAILSSLQGYGDRILKKSLEQSPWLPENSKNTCIGLSDTYLHGSKNLRKLVEQGFDEMERLVSRTSVSRESEKTVKSIPAPRPAEPAARKQAGGRKSAPPQKTAAPEKSIDLQKPTTDPQKPTDKSSGTTAAAPMTTPVQQSTAPPPGMTPAPKPSVAPATAPGTFTPASPPSKAATTGMQSSGPPEKIMKDDSRTTGKIS